MWKIFLDDRYRGNCRRKRDWTQLQMLYWTCPMVSNHSRRRTELFHTIPYHPNSAFIDAASRFHLTFRTVVRMEAPRISECGDLAGRERATASILALPFDRGGCRDAAANICIFITAGYTCRICQYKYLQQSLQNINLVLRF